MCLAIPGRLDRINEGEGGGVRMGIVDFDGVRRSVCLAYVPEAAIGSYILVHAGFAISIIDPVEASRIFEQLKAMDALEHQDGSTP